MSERTTTPHAEKPSPIAAWAATSLLAFLCLLLISADARGGQTGQEFLELCNGGGTWAEGYCTGYVTGAGELIDGLLLEEDLKAALDGKAFCLPGDLRKGQVRDLVLDYLRAHPEVRDKQITTVTWAALIDAFPCA